MPNGISAPLRQSSLSRFMVVMSIGLATGGCGGGFPFGFGGERETPLVTGSIARPGMIAEPAALPLTGPVATIPPPGLTEEDWRRARGALTVALDPVGDGAPVAWSNPLSGAAGQFKPDGQVFLVRDEVCRGFTGRMQASQRASDVQGHACRLGAGEWWLKALQTSARP